MSADNRLSTGKKIISVFLGALMTAFLWRVRGNHGFGGSWGLFCVSTGITLLVFAFYGNRARIKYELIPVGTIMMGLAVPGWGIVNQLMGGIIPNTAADPVTGEAATAVINGWHGLFLMLMTGFALVCIYGIFIGTLFSKREYRIWQYAVYIAVFFAVSYIAKLTFSHVLLKAVAPEIVENFKAGLAATGSEKSVSQVFISSIFNTSAMKKIPFGRAYAESIEHIAYASGAVALIIAALVIFRDGITAAVSFAVNTITMIGFTASDVFNINRYSGNGSILRNVTLPGIFRITSWSLWEFFTGFFIGLGIMLVIAVLPDALTSGKKYRNEAVIENRILRFLYNFVLVFGFAILAEPVRAFGLRLADTLEGASLITEDKNDMFSFIIMGIAGIAVAVPVLIILKKNIIDKNLPVPVRKKPNVFALDFLPVFILCVFVIYLLPSRSEMDFWYQLIKNPTAQLLSDNISILFCVASVILFCVMYFPVRKRLLSHH